MAWNKRVQPNSNMRRMPAKAYNNFVSAAEDYLNRKMSVQGSGYPNKRDGSKSWVYGVPSTLDAAVSTGDIVGIGDVRVTPTDSEDEYQSSDPWFDLTEITEGENDQKWGIVLEPIESSSDIGKVAISGYAKTSIYVNDADDMFAEFDFSASPTPTPLAASTTQLTSTTDNSKIPIIWKESGTGLVEAVVFIKPLGGGGGGGGAMYQATADRSGSAGSYTVEAKAIALDGTLATTTETLNVFDDSYPIRTGDLLVTVIDKDGETAVVRIQGNSTSVYTLAAGTDDTAQTDTWNINSQPSGKQGVKVEKWFRLYWSGTSEDPIYQFTREGTYDSAGNLIAVSAETRSIAFTTAECP